LSSIPALVADGHLAGSVTANNNNMLTRAAMGASMAFPFTNNSFLRFFLFLCTGSVVGLV
jgi:hypothetical protein